MEYLYIDESGSMTSQYSNINPYFVISIVRASNPRKLKNLHKRFVEKHMEELLALDTNSRMFKNGKFEELKGSMFTPELKRAFVSDFCRPDILEIFYIVVKNNAVSIGLYKNTARAFNYILKLALEHFIKTGCLTDDTYLIQLDERNERTETRHFLQNYLNTEFRMSGLLSHDINVNYYDSSKNRLIQIADVFANLYFSELMTNAYSSELKTMETNGCLKKVFRFPLGWY